MSTAIKVENLSKKYILNHQGQERYLALRDVIANKAKGILNSNQLKQNQEEFWALRDLNFEIKQGDRVGIIGRNGAGKSTLLKILSRITEPTTGKIKLKGRVASLLEVGTGFHPELTGRENIFLNGAILGMSKWEIKKKFDEIVAFAEVEKFLDTPVKRYSSGMYVRLAFAVAAHLEPEILIVDEVLAVGDAQFQKKCLGRMEEVGKEGRTVLFVSHNIPSIERLCNVGIFLKDGKLFQMDNTKKIISNYLFSNEVITSSLRGIKNRVGDGEIRFASWNTVVNGIVTNTWICGQPGSLVIHLENTNSLNLNDDHSLLVGVSFDNSNGERVAVFNNEINGDLIHVKSNVIRVKISIEKVCFLPGDYTLTFFCSKKSTIKDWIINATKLEVLEGDFYGTGKLPEGQGSILLNYKYALCEE